MNAKPRYMKGRFRWISGEWVCLRPFSWTWLCEPRSDRAWRAVSLNFFRPVL